MQKTDIKYNVLKSNKAFEQRENNEIQTPYETETEFFATIEQGDTEKMEKVLKNIIDGGIVVGRLSHDELRQAKYWAICCITIGTRHAIKGGLDERTAFNLSNEAIWKIDLMDKKEDVLLFLAEKSREITDLVGKSKGRRQYSKDIRRCIRYIDENLHGDLSLKTLSSVCGFSREYLSVLFKKETGVSLSCYIKQQRLSEAAELLREGMSISDVAYSTGFSSESYFIKCFREKYALTPGEYQKND